MTAYVFRISLECPHCRTGVPVNAFTEEVLCNNCLKGIPLDQGWWRRMLDEETIDEAMDFEPGNGNSARHLGGLNETVESGNRPPRCQSCKAEFSQQLMTGALDKNRFACPGCQQAIRVRKAMDWVKAIIPNADLLVHEDEDGKGLGNDGHADVEPVLFACLACGAGLPVDGSSRTPKCTHCGSSNYLPDPLWLRLHPAAVSHAFFVTLPPDLKPKPISPDSLQDDLDADKALRILKDPNLDAAVLRRIYQIYQIQNGFSEDELNMALAAHPNTPDDVLMKLCGDDVDTDAKIRIANRPTIGGGTYITLSSTNDRDVKKAIVARNDFWMQPENIHKRVFKDLPLRDVEPHIQRTDFPEWALYDLAQNAEVTDAFKIMKAPNVSLRILKRLASIEGARTMIKQHKLFLQQGWLGRTFFFMGT